MIVCFGSAQHGPMPLPTCQIISCYTSFLSTKSASKWDALFSSFLVVFRPVAAVKLKASHAQWCTSGFSGIYALNQTTPLMKNNELVLFSHKQQQYSSHNKSWNPLDLLWPGCIRAMELNPRRSPLPKAAKIKRSRWRSWRFWKLSFYLQWGLDMLPEQKKSTNIQSICI